MDTPHVVLESGSETTQILRATVVAIDGATVEIHDDVDSCMMCDILSTAGNAPQFAVGDQVLAWHSGRAEERGVILGRIGGTAAAEVDNDAPDELVIEAKHSLTLRVGEGSITIREDGKILIKGKDLVSHAQRLNRIKGGSVQIN